MKKVARLRGTENQNDYIPPPNAIITASQIEQVTVRTTGRIKKPKAVFDPSDNYLPKSQRLSVGSNNTSTALVPYGSPLLEREKHQIGAISSPTATATLQKNVSPNVSNVSVGKSPSPTTTSAPNVKQLIHPAEKNFYCNICGKGEAKRGANAKNKLINCNGCKKRIHKLCLKTDFEDLDVLIRNYKCINCRICHVCNSHPNCEKSMITCAKCVKSYHYTCHVPSLLKLDQHQNNWKCSSCLTPKTNNNSVRNQRKTIERETVKNEVNANADVATISSTTTPITTTTNGGDGAVDANVVKNSIHFSETPSPVNVTTTTATTTTTTTGNTKRKSKPVAIDDYDSKPIIINNNETNYVTIKKRKLETAATNDNAAAVIQKFVPYNAMEMIDIPTGVKSWTVDEVVSFFSKYFPKEAKVFKDHEIDGVSLMLMNRGDVVKKLPFKLGPSLRIYNLILKLQKEVNNVTLSWDL